MQRNSLFHGFGYYQSDWRLAFFAVAMEARGARFGRHSVGAY